ncbi:MAG: gliding motility protein GldM [Flavobacteriales bacterium]|nr:gliding motility protein GldM [Flavobacteriales bacterium]
MAGGKQSPRQKMINLMYLVFIAMLAMNIDREVLRSFENVEMSLTDATGLSNKNNNAFYGSIDKKAKDDPDGYGPVKAFTDVVKQKSDDLAALIDKIKASLDTKTGWKAPVNGEESSYNSLGNTDVLNSLMFVAEGKPTADAQALKDKVDDFREFLLKNLDPNKDALIINQVKTLFNTQGKGKKTWLQVLFDGQPMIAGKTNLTKIQSDVRTVEGNIIRNRLSTKLMQDVELKAFQGVVMAPVYLAEGEDGTATVALGAFDNGLRGTAVVNGQSYPLVGGKATIPLSGKSAGKYTLSGKINFIDKGGKPGEAVLAPAAYEVVKQISRDPQQPVGVVSADKMQVVYRGLPNPISASVTGVKNGTVNLRASGGSLVKAGKGWTLTPSTGSEVTLTVSGTTEKGASYSEAFKFRIKNVPAPQGQIRGKTSLSIPASSLSKQVVTATIPDFEWPVNFTVKSCKVKVSGKPTLSVSGASLGAAERLTQGLRSGDVVNVFDIEVEASGLGDQRIKNVSPVAITIL